MTLTARSYVRISAAALWARRVGALSLPVIVLAAIGHRTGAVASDSILPVLTLGFGLGLLAAGLVVVALTDIWITGAHGFRNAVIGTIYAAPALLLTATATAGVLLYPRMTDITTDLVDVPEFADAALTAVEGEPDRALQVEAYPEVTARFYPSNFARTFLAVRTVVNDRGWTVTHVAPPPQPVLAPADPAVAPGQPSGSEPAGTSPPPAEAEPEAAPTAQASVEAIARTLLFAFPDRVVVRLIETERGTRVDMRSVSGIGTHDLGQNARRILGFFTDLDAVLQGMEDAAPAEEALPSGPAPAVPVPRPATR